MQDKKDEHEALEAGVKLTRELRAEADRLGIDPKTATDEQLRPLLRLLPQALIEDARTTEGDKTEATMIAFIRLMFDKEQKQASSLLN